MVISFLAAIAWASIRAKQRGMKPETIQDASFWMIAAGIFGARLTYILLHLRHYIENSGELFTLRFEGLTSFGGLVGGFAALWIYSKRSNVPMLKFLDVVSMPVLLAHAIGRVGCLLNGCCYGHLVATSPPGVQFQGMPGYYLPAQIYDSAMVMLGLLALLALEKRYKYQGFSFGSMMVVYGISRFIYEFWRIGASSENLPGLPISLAQVAAIAMVIVGFVIMNYGKKLSAAPKGSDEPAAAGIL